MKQLNRVLSLLLASCLVFPCMPMGALAAETETTYAVTVVNGTAEPEKARAGEKVTLIPEIPEGKIFADWQVAPEVYAELEIQENQFIMPEAELTITANLADIPANTGKTSSTTEGSVPPTTEQTVPPTTEQTVPPTTEQTVPPTTVETVPSPANETLTSNVEAPLANQQAAPVWESFNWVEKEEYLAEGKLVLPGVSMEKQASFEDVVGMLPVAITLPDDTQVAIDHWECEEFKQDGNWPLAGSFLFTAVLSQEVTFAESAPKLQVSVELPGSVSTMAAGYLTYLDKEGINQLVPSTPVEIAADTTELTADWYAVSADVTVFDKMTVKPGSTVNLLLKDNGRLNARGIEVPAGATLIIYAQSSQDSAVGNILVGRMSTVGGDGMPGIGGDGNIEIYGGVINTTGGEQAAGIGGGLNSIIQIAGCASVTATGANGGAGIGSGVGSAYGSVEIGGHASIVASGTGGGAGIGGGANSTGGTVTIYGGEVTATGGAEGGDGIGGSGSSFSTGDGGNAIITASSITNTGTEGWSGIISVDGGTNYTVYGNPVRDRALTLGGNLTIPKGRSLTISVGRFQAAHITNNGLLALSVLNRLEEIQQWYAQKNLDGDGIITLSGKVYNNAAEPLYTITYVLGEGGQNAPGNPAFYSGTGPDVTLADPTKPGYEFTGWTYEGETTPQKTVTIPTGSTGDKTYTANWNLISYTITYELGEGGQNALGNPESYTIENTGITLKAPTRDGYEFTGWTYEGETTPRKTVTIPAGSTGNKTYTANWMRNSLPAPTVTADPENGEAVYPAKVTLTAQFTERPGAIYTYTWYRGEVQAGEGKSLPIGEVTDSGDYKVIVTEVMNGETNSSSYSAAKKVTIKKADITGTITQDGTLVYDEMCGPEMGWIPISQTPALKNSLNANGQSIKVEYGKYENFDIADASDKPYSIQIPGDYTVYFKATAPNHNDLRGSFQVTMKKGEIRLCDWTWKVPDTMVYNGKIHRVVPNPDNPGWDKITATYQNEATDAGTYTAKADVLNMPQRQVGLVEFSPYDSVGEIPDFTWVIQKADPTADLFMVSNATVTYDGKEQQPTVTFNGQAADGTKLTGMGAVTVTTRATNAGEVTPITFSVAEGKNFHAAELTLDQLFKIEKVPAKVVTAPVGAKDLVERTVPQALVDDTNAKAEGGSFQYLQSDGSYSDKLPTGQGKGDHTVTYMVVGDQNHLDSAPQTLTATISTAAEAAKPYIPASDLTQNNVKSTDKAALEENKKQLQQIMGDPDTLVSKEDLQAALDANNALLDQIQKAESVKDNGIKKADSITPNTVEMKDKAALQKTVKDLEAAKKDYAGNYTPEQIREMDKAIANAQKCLDTIQGAEDLLTSIQNLPAPKDVDAGDPNVKAAVTASLTRQLKLTTHQKQMVKGAQGTKLADVQKALFTYKIVDGDNQEWKDGKGDLTITCNGCYGIFTGLKVDRSLLRKGTDYTVKEGSTVATLKASYLKGLGSGKHMVTFYYNADGVEHTASGSFQVAGKGWNPTTGDQFRAGLWISLLAVSAIGAGALVYFAVKKKKK